jgi:hypothetical protein
MKYKAIAALLILSAAQPALAAKFTMQLKAGSEQTMRMEGGLAAVDSHAAGSSVRLMQHEGDLKKRGAVQLLVMNHGDRQFNFGPENVTAKLADGTAVAIISYDRLVREEKKRQTWAAIAGGLAAAANSMNAANAGRVSGTAAYRGSTFGTFGATPYNATTFGTATISGYDHGRAQVAQSLANQQNQQNFAAMAAQNEGRMEALKLNMRTTTVDPQQMFGGTVVFELPKSVHKGKSDVPVTFLVTIEGEQHAFEGLLKRR